MPTMTHFQRELLRRLLATMGFGVVAGAASGCGGGTGPATSDGGSSDASSSNDAANSDDASLRDSIIGQPPPPFPPGPFPDGDTPDDKACAKLVVSRDARPPPGMCPADDGGAQGHRNYTCLPAPPPGQSCSDVYSDACVLNTYNCGLSSRGQLIVCGPLTGDNDTCCYVIGGSCPVGRPFLVDGIARLAPASDDPSWAMRLHPDVDGLSVVTRAALADVWTQDALTEHASVASFSRFVLQCLAVGAPADIVRDAQQACVDELEHARVAFGLASAYAGRTIGPGRLDVTRSLDAALDATDIACSVAAEGCIAELVSAALLADASDGARDAVVKSVLATMAEQELDHAILAWRYLAWAIGMGGLKMRERVGAVLGRMREHVAFGARTSLPGDAAALRAHGYLQIDERRRIATGILENVVRPAVQALLGGATAFSSNCSGARDPLNVVSSLTRRA